MEIYDKNLGYYFLKKRMNDFYLKGKQKSVDKDNFRVKVLGKNGDQFSGKKYQKISLTINYPGLLIGTGTKIELSPVNDEKLNDKDLDNFNNGLSFDYTTGLPYIPGSSLKGVLRSFFPDIEKLEETEESKAKVDILNSLSKKDFTEEEWRKIASLIFEGQYNGIPISVSIRDKFIEGVIAVDTEKEVLGSDFITPHKNILGNPIPIKILKVKAGIAIDLLFELHDTYDIGGELLLSKEEKLVLFEKILYLTGLGAKTSTGYGHFDLEENERMKEVRKEFLKKEEENEELRAQIAERERLEQEKAKKKEEQEKLKAQMSESEKFLYQFDNEWTDDEKKGKFNEFIELPDEKIRKELVGKYLELFKDSKSKKTKAKVEKLKSMM